MTFIYPIRLTHWESEKRILIMIKIILMLGIALMQIADTSRQKAENIFKDVWSPYCKGISLQECSSSKASELRMNIERRIEAGESPESIRAELLKTYGPQLRMEPESSGREGLAFIIPWICLALGALLVALYWRRKKKIPKPQSPSVEYPSDKILRDIEERLR